MRAYHFIKYNETTTLDNLIAESDINTILCFDFEDSIQDCIYPVNNSVLKANYRSYFKIIIDNCKLDLNKINIGVRLNPTDSSEYFLDLIAIAGIKHIHAIFLPKITTAEQILKLQNDLESNGINYNEIIPVIESKAGLNNLERVLRKSSTKIKSLAFGHCDYNFDNQHYPYFHQDSREYWTWITKIFELIESYNLSLVNSPFLWLDNDEYFIKMLCMLRSICGNNCAQIVLTKKQAILCNSFNIDTGSVIPLKINNRLDLSVPDCYAEKFIESFEKNYQTKGFAIDDNRVLLSPQEYFSSLNYLNKVNYPRVNFTFVGGCFPVQGNLPFENLFHQLLKHKTESIREVKFNVNIIRYERFRNCVNKIALYKENKPIDILTFSIRPEPFLRLVKLYYRFLDNTSNRKKWSLNLPRLNKVNPEKFDLLTLDTIFNFTETDGSSIFRKALINLNYFFGTLIGNDNYALSKYLELVNEVIEFSRRNNIELFIIGPPIRTNTIMDRLLSKRLDKFMRKSLRISQDSFISGSNITKNGENLFEKNGVYATEKYHELISARLLEKILPKIDKIKLIDNTLPKA